MTTAVAYADERFYVLPDGWEPVRTELLDTASPETRADLRGEDAVKRIADYYDPAGGYAGSTFLKAAPHAAD